MGSPPPPAPRVRDFTNAVQFARTLLYSLGGLSRSVLRLTAAGSARPTGRLWAGGGSVSVPLSGSAARAGVHRDRMVRCLVVSHQLGRARTSQRVPWDCTGSCTALRQPGAPVIGASRVPSAPAKTHIAQRDPPVPGWPSPAITEGHLGLTQCPPRPGGCSWVVQWLWCSTGPDRLTARSKGSAPPPPANRNGMF